MLGLYSKRYSTAWGWHWKKERDCGDEEADGWLAVFKKDEPEVRFKLSKKKPSCRVDCGI